MRSDVNKMVARLWGGVFGVCVFLGFVSWGLAGHSAVWGLAPLGLFVAGGLAVWLTERAGRSAEWLVPLVVLGIFVLLPELLLRAAMFEHAPGIQFGYPDPVEFRQFEWDKDRFWKEKTDDSRVNSYGFRDPEPVVPKPPGTRRIVFLGDSCTAEGSPRYPARVAKRSGTEAVTMAVSGYSSHQGRVIAESILGEVSPDVVVVYYGWNDHWQAHGAVDSQKRLPAPNPAWEALREGSRLVQGLQWIAQRLGDGGAPLPEVRVPPEDYRRNLLAIAEATAAPVVFVTAPTAHYARGAPAALVERRKMAPDVGSIVERHRAYAQITREVAAQAGSTLLDLERDWAEHPELEQIFLSDGIHFTNYGMDVVAEAISEALPAGP